jgi:hypothetical protein
MIKTVQSRGLIKSLRDKFKVYQQHLDFQSFKKNQVEPYRLTDWAGKKKKKRIRVKYFIIFLNFHYLLFTLT